MLEGYLQASHKSFGLSNRRLITSHELFPYVWTHSTIKKPTDKQITKTATHPYNSKSWKCSHSCTMFLHRNRANMKSSVKGASGMFKEHTAQISFNSSSVHAQHFDSVLFLSNTDPVSKFIYYCVNTSFYFYN